MAVARFANLHRHRSGRHVDSRRLHCLSPIWVLGRMSDKNHERAVRYRRLALAEPDKSKAALLQKIADEADKGVLVTADWMTAARYMGEPEKTG
jgi:hypothetical protein